jgi:seryl-tRNA synthetase
VVSLAESTGSAAEKNEKLNSSLKLLATTVSEYRNWIDALEKAEDELRKNQQEDKQKAMANAANKLRELQKNQGDISSKLDRADARENEIAKDWNATASSQQKNKKETEALVGEMATMSPEGAKRLQAAADAMEETMTSGSTKNFSTAESMSDMAGRLLSQSQKSLQDNKEDQGRQPRKRRQTSGDNSFGTQVSGNVDLKREYSVDKKYREEILDSINETPAAKEDLPLLNNYLRKTVR